MNDYFATKNILSCFSGVMCLKNSVTIVSDVHDNDILYHNLYKNQ